MDRRRIVQQRRICFLVSIIFALIMTFLFRPAFYKGIPDTVLVYGDTTGWPAFMRDFWPLDLLGFFASFFMFSYMMMRADELTISTPVGALKSVGGIGVVGGGFVSLIIVGTYGWTGWPIGFVLGFVLLGGFIAIFTALLLVAGSVGPTLAYTLRFAWAFAGMLRHQSTQSHREPRRLPPAVAVAFRRIRDYYDAKDVPEDRR